MNYLGHFHFNRLHLGRAAASPLFHLGAALPDLLSSHDRRYRFRLRTVDQMLELQPSSPMWRGIKNHLLADTVFHKSRFFKSSNAKLFDQLQSRLNEHQNRRLFFLSHIGTELLLDHLLLVEDRLLAKAFYENLEQADMTFATDQLQEFFGDNLAGLTGFFDRFMSIRYLEQYRTVENVAFGINRMLERTAQTPFSGSENESFTAVLSDATAMIAVRIEDLACEFEAFYNRQEHH